MVTLLYRTLKRPLGKRHGNSAHVGDDCIQNCGQTAADRDMVTIDSL